MINLESYMASEKPLDYAWSHMPIHVWICLWWSYQVLCDSKDEALRIALNYWIIPFADRFKYETAQGLTPYTIEECSNILEISDKWLPQHTDLGPLIICEVYENLDEPRLLLARGVTEYLVYWTGEDPDWLYTEISQETLLRLKRKELTIRQALAGGEKHYLLCGDRVEKAEEVDPDLLPKKGYYLMYDE